MNGLKNKKESKQMKEIGNTVFSDEVITDAISTLKELDSRMTHSIDSMKKFAERLPKNSDKQVQAMFTLMLATHADLMVILNMKTLETVNGLISSLYDLSKMFDILETGLELVVMEIPTTEESKNLKLELTKLKDEVSTIKQKRLPKTETQIKDIRKELQNYTELDEVLRIIRERLKERGVDSNGRD